MSSICFVRCANKINRYEITESYSCRIERAVQWKRHFYFGSIAAIFDELSEEQIGIKKESLWNVDLSRVEYQNKYCTIRMGFIKRKKLLEVILKKEVVYEKREDKT